jgi:hypothetical protein
MRWLARYGGLLTTLGCLPAAFLLPHWAYWTVFVPWMLFYCWVLWRMTPSYHKVKVQIIGHPRVHVHPEMLPIAGREKYVVAEALNSGKPVFAVEHADGRLDMHTLDIDMSIEAHPNIHAVRFLCDIAEAVLRDRRIPSDGELDRALRRSLRGKATMSTPIDWPGLKESFAILMEDVKKLDEEDGDKMRKRFITSFVCTISERLDYAIEHNATEWQGMT